MNLQICHALLNLLGHTPSSCVHLINIYLSLREIRLTEATIPSRLDALGHWTLFLPHALVITWLQPLITLEVGTNIWGHLLFMGVVCVRFVYVLVQKGFFFMQIFCECCINI